MKKKIVNYGDELAGKPFNALQLSKEQKEQLLGCIEYLHVNNKGNYQTFWYPTLVNFVNYNLPVESYRNRIELLATNSIRGKGATLKKLIIRYGDVEGEERYNKYRNAQAESNTFEYKKEKYGWTEQQFDDYNQSRAVTRSNLISRHGELIGLEKWNSYLEKQRYTCSQEYFIEKYGPANGVKKYNNFVYRRRSLIDATILSEVHSVPLDVAQDIIIKRKSPGKYCSKMERDFLDVLLHWGFDIEYHVGNKQFCIWDELNHAPKFYDFVNSKKKKVIEFNGDYWHANPNKYSENFINPTTKRSAKDIWDADEHKLSLIRERGFDVFVVWETQFRNNRDETLKELYEWWNK